MPTAARTQRAQAQHRNAGGQDYRQIITGLQTMRTEINARLDNLILTTSQYFGSQQGWQGWQGNATAAGVTTAHQPVGAPRGRPVSAATRRKLSKIMRDRAAQQKVGTTTAKGRAAAA